MNIVIVEDWPTETRPLKKNLNRHGYKVDIAETRGGALASQNRTQSNV